ncbi:MAG: T9SS type A sorting domain-containing protein [Bacteroidales bacterium]|nr:T9SS type A sorting domain-containing protein [Bacteroidales bacterium]
MIRKISQLLIMFLLFIPVMKGQEVQLGSVTEADPGGVEIDLNMLGFTGANGDVGAITYTVEYPTDLLSFQGLSFENPDFAPITANFYNDQLIIVATNMNGVNIDGLLATLDFEYAGGFPAELEFVTEECEITTIEFVNIDATYTNGMVEPNLTGTAGMVSINTEVAPVGSEVSVPVDIEGPDFDEVSAISLKIAYDTDKLTFQGISENTYGFVANGGNGLIEMEWTGGPEDFTSAVTLLNLDFVYNGGGLAPLEFQAGSLVSNQTEVLATEFIDGSIDLETPGGNRELTIDQVSSMDSTTVNVPIIAANLADDDVASINLNIAFDTEKLSYAGFNADQFSGWSVNTGQGSVYLVKTDNEGLTIEDGELVTLIFDYTTGQADVAFEPGTIIQNTDLETLPVMLNDGYVINTTQSISLISGFQFVSTRIIPENPDMLVVLEEILDDRLNFVRNSNASELRKIGPMWINNIGDWETVEGYLFSMNDAAEFTTNGPEIDPQTPINFESGYEFISYLPNSPINALDAFETIMNDDLDFVRNSTGGMLRKIGNQWINNIGDAMPGEGYLVKSMGAQELIYPANPQSMLVGNDAEPTYFTFEGGNPAEEVYTLYIDGDLEAGDEIAAFDGDQMVGAAVITSGNKYLNDLPIFKQVVEGEGYQPGNVITLKVYDRSEDVVSLLDYTMMGEYDARTAKTFPQNDGEYGVAEVEKMTTGIDKLNAEVAMYPNPAHTSVKIESPDAIRSLRVYNYTGQVVAEKVTTNKLMEVNVESFDSGIYIVEIETVSGKLTRKLTVK